MILFFITVFFRLARTEEQKRGGEKGGRAVRDIAITQVVCHRRLEASSGTARELENWRGGLRTITVDVQYRRGSASFPSTCYDPSISSFDRPVPPSGGSIRSEEAPTTEDQPLRGSTTTARRGEGEEGDDVVVGLRTSCSSSIDYSHRRRRHHQLGSSPSCAITTSSLSSSSAAIVDAMDRRTSPPPLTDLSTLKRPLAVFRRDHRVELDEQPRSPTRVHHSDAVADRSLVSSSFISPVVGFVDDERGPEATSSSSSYLALPRPLSDPDRFTSLGAVLDGLSTMTDPAGGRSTKEERSSWAPAPAPVSSSSSSSSSSPTAHEPQLDHGRPTRSTSDSSASTESSPTTTTTTSSTVDSPTVTDCSPSSSPESPPPPAAATASSPFHLASPPRSKAVPAPLRPVTEPSFLTPPVSPVFGPSGLPTSPARRPRNTKNLSLNVANPSRPPPTLRIKTASAVGAADVLSAPASPAATSHQQQQHHHHHPPLRRPSRRRPGHLGLTVRTPAFPSGPAGLDGAGLPPSSPWSSRPNVLRHHQSSPALSLFSPITGIVGGMRLPAHGPGEAPVLPSPWSRTTTTTTSSSSSSSSSSSFSGSSSSQPLPSMSVDAGTAGLDGSTSPTALVRLTELEEENNVEGYPVPLSQEVKSPAYPAGPVCVYHPHVYLYLEPNHDEAAQFDVILNVAREVRNPFSDRTVGHGDGDGDDDDNDDDNDATVSLSIDVPHPERWWDDDDGRCPRQSTLVPWPPVVARTRSLEAASTASAVVGPVHPGAPRPSQRGPEYVHVPWDHNSNIVDDLLGLVELIDDRVRRGKRVLVHCQCGVSRSASLIVAYGLYRDPSRTVQEVYDAVKRKSRWIGPNMSLIYQLSEFRTKMIHRRGLAPWHTRSWRGAGATGTGRANTLPSDPGREAAATAASFVGSALEPRRSAPQTAPLPLDHHHHQRRHHDDHRSGRIGSVDIHASPSRRRPFLNEGHHRDLAPGPSSAPLGPSWETSLGGMDRSSLSPPPSPRAIVAPSLPSTLVPPPPALTSISSMTSTPIPPAPTRAPPAPPAPPPPPPPLLDLVGDVVMSAEPCWPRLQPGDIVAPSALVAPLSPPLRPPPGGPRTNHVISLAPRSMADSVDDGDDDDDVGLSPSIPMSPRASMFTANPLHDPPATSMLGLRTGFPIDPRSPAYRGEMPIIRSIFDVL